MTRREETSPGESPADVVLRTEKFHVERRSIIRRNVRLERHIVVHPGAAVILPILDGDRVVLIENERVSAGRALLELPAGTLEPDEPPIECAARELEEETGYVAGNLESLVEFFATPGFCTERMYVFVATHLSVAEQRLDPGEIIEPRVLAYQEAIDAIRSGRIEDGKTIAALLHYDRFVRPQRGHR